VPEAAYYIFAEDTMFYPSNTLTPLERIVFSLRAIYSSHGFTKYKMSKFEEYDFYARNKDFLVSDSVITFTDTNGKLMALKPDVTLSIVKNDPDHPDSVRKVFYDENVYRVSLANDSFREIKQTGLECVGGVDAYHLAEVTLLAAQSLKAVSDDFILTVSDLDILLALVGDVSSDALVKNELIKCVGEKNTHGLDEAAVRFALDEKKVSRLKELVSLYGDPADVISRLESFSDISGIGEGICVLKRTLRIFEGTELEKNVQIDFSTVGDLNYYNGIVFKGYVCGVPDSVLSGGQYDRLMDKLGRRSRAVGFAVYLDMLDRLGPPSSEYDADVMLVYDTEADVKEIRDAIDCFVSAGKTVAAVTAADRSLNCREAYKLSNGEVKALEDDA
jgi:ATP phosphoribosyltransferase regulatory subunit